MVGKLSYGTANLFQTKTVFLCPQLNAPTQLVMSNMESETDMNPLGSEYSDEYDN